MSGYILGLLTLPIGLAAIFVAWFVVKAGYLALGLLGKVGVVRFGNGRNEYRYRAGAVVASSRRIILLNKDTTGVVFFSGLANPRTGFGSVTAYESGIRRAAAKVDQVDAS